jgi:hypothetical protein
MNEQSFLKHSKRAALTRGLLFWTRYAATTLTFDSVRRPNVLTLLEVTDDDPQIQSVLDIGRQLFLKTSVRIIVILAFALGFCETTGLTHVSDQTTGRVRGKGTIVLAGLKLGSSILGPGNMATTAEKADGTYSVTLPVGNYEISPVSSKTLIQRIPLKVRAGMWGTIQLEDWTDGLIIRGPDTNVRNDGVISVATKAEVSCDSGRAYLAVHGRGWFLLPQVTTG